tara:strand:- start:3532 stop:3786 length:255 start_codon:yes stop_codon:yes gene_type:complete
MEDENIEVENETFDTPEIEVEDENIENEESQSMEADFVNAVAEDDFRNAGDMFSTMLGNKMRDALEAERINIGSNMFNSSEAEN